MNRWLADDIAYVNMLHAKYFGPGKPFYWTAPYETGCAPTGWYQWTERGLEYLGASILAERCEAREREK